MPRKRKVAMRIERVSEHKEKVTSKLLCPNKRTFSRFDLPRLLVKLTAQFALITKLIDGFLLF